MGPGDGIQKQRLLDLPTTIETADQTNQRVSTSIRHAPAPPRSQRPVLPPYNGKNCLKIVKCFELFKSKLILIKKNRCQACRTPTPT